MEMQLRTEAVFLKREQLSTASIRQEDSAEINLDLKYASEQVQRYQKAPYYTSQEC